MEITGHGAQIASKKPEVWFTGAVRIDKLFQPDDVRGSMAAVITSEPDQSVLASKKNLMLR